MIGFKCLNLGRPIDILKYSINSRSMTIPQSLRFDIVEVKTQIAAHSKFNSTKMMANRKHQTLQCDTSLKAGTRTSATHDTRRSKKAKTIATCLQPKCCRLLHFNKNSRKKIRKKQQLEIQSFRSLNLIFFCFGVCR